MLEIQELLQLVFDRAASDLHIKAGQPPIIRVAGKLIKSTLPPLSKEEVQRLIFRSLHPSKENSSNRPMNSIAVSVWTASVDSASTYIKIEVRMLLHCV